MADDSINLGVADYLANPEQPVGPALKDSLLHGVQQQPDMQARMRAAARDLNVPFPTVFGDKDYALAQSDVMRLDPNGMVRTAPKTATWLSEPDNAAVAHDDVDVLKNIEQTVRNLGAITKGSALAIGELPYDAAQAVNEFIDPFGEMGLAQRRSLDPKTGTFRAEGPQTSVQALGARMRGQAQAAMPTTENWMQAGVNSGVASLLQNAPGVIIALATKNPELGLALMASQTGLQSYGEARDAGLDPAAAAGHGAKQGAIEGLTEKLPMEALLKDLKVGSGVIKTWAHQMLADVPGEIGATISQNFNDWADLHPDKPFMDYVAQLPEDIGATVIATAMGTAGHTAMEQVAHAAQAHVAGTQAKAEQAQAAEKTQGVLDGLVKAASASALRERDPQTFKEYVDTVTKDHPVDRVYVNAQDLVDVLAQGSPEKLAENTAVLQAMPSVMPQLEDAVKTGGLVEIPISELLAFTPETSLGQSLMEHLKVDPEAMSMAESQEFLQSHAAAFKDEVAKIVEQKGLNDEFQASFDQVHQHIKGQLDTANRFTTDVNEAYATFVAHAYATQAARIGVTPAELFAQRPLNIQAQGVTEGSLMNQEPIQDDTFPATQYQLTGQRKTVEGVDYVEAHITSTAGGSESTAFLPISGEHAVAALARAVAEQPRQYPMADRGEWYGEADYEARGGRLVQMAPEDYLARVRPLQMDEVSRENIDDLKAHIQAGKTLDPLLIRADGKEDGRHRAHAAAELGIPSVPVVVYGDELLQTPAHISYDPGLGFQSTLFNTVTSAKQAKASAEQWLAMLHNAPGVKKEELEWIGLPEALALMGQEGAISREQVLTYIAQNGVRLEEVVNDGTAPTQDEIRSRAVDLAMEADERDQEGLTEDELEDWSSGNTWHDFADEAERELRGESGGGFDPQYADYQAIKGGENYREVLITLPTKDANNVKTTYLNPRLQRDFSASMGHWDHDNVLAHIRLADFTTPDGKRVLGVLEIQSDWHQKGRDKGYAVAASPEAIAKAEQAEASARAVQQTKGEALLDLMPDLMAARIAEMSAKRDELRAEEKRLMAAYGEAEQRVVAAGEARDAEARGTAYAEWAAIAKQHEQARQKASTLSDHINEAKRLHGNLTHWLDKGQIEPRVDAYGMAARMFKNINWGGTELVEQFVEASTLVEDLRGADLSVIEAVSATRAAKGEGGIPDAPFKAAWPALSMKRVLREAIEKGYDHVAWATGEQQADLYDMREVLDGSLDIRLAQTGDHYNPGVNELVREYTAKGQGGTYEVGMPHNIAEAVARAGHGYALDNYGRGRMSVLMTETSVREMFGGDLGGRMLTAAGNAPLGGNAFSSISGDGFAVGGEGHKAFYNRNLVNITNDIVKKFGAKVGVVELATPSEADSYFHPARIQADIADRQARIAELERERAAHPGTSLAETLREEIEYAQGNLQADQEALARMEAGQKSKQWGFPITEKMRAEEKAVSPPLFQAQDATTARGSFNPQTSTITLLRNADLSTFLHETGHFFLEMLAHLATDENAPQGLKDDWAKAADFVGFGGADPAAWLAIPVDARREGHERWARGFEAYLRDGKAPAPALKGVFQRFKSWLVHIYQNLTQLNVELTPEVRGVFDRLLASEQEIAKTEAARAYAPVFDTKPDGMSDLEWEAYQRLGAEATADAEDQLQARSIRDMRWLQHQRSRLIRQLAKEAREKRQAMRAEVEAETLAEPTYAAMQFLRRGTLNGEAAEGPHKLAIAAVEDLYKDTPKELQDWRKLGYGKYGMLAEEGLDPNHVAELFGFTSGDELVEALMNAEPMREKIDGLTDQRMLERYGDLTDQDAIEKAADEAIHNDARLRFVATEANALAKAAGRTRVMAEAARDFAREMVGRLRIRDVKPAKYTGAETRAATAAAKAAAKGDLVEAATQKRNQLLNGYAARAAFQAQKDVDAALRYFDRLDSAGSRKGIDPTQRDQIDALLERFDLRKGQSLKAIDKRKSLKSWIEAMQAQGLDPIIDDQLVNEAYRKHYKDLSVDEMRGLVDAIKNIVHLGRVKNRLLMAAQGRRLDAVRGEMAQTVADNAYKTNALQREFNTFGDGVRRNVLSAFAIHRKLASLLREMGGNKARTILWDAITRPMNERFDWEAVRREQATKALFALYRPLIEAKNLRKKMFIPEIGDSLSTEGRIAVALNWGNELNRARIMDGEKWTADQAAAVLQTLTAEQLGFVNGMWEYLDGYWPEIAAKQRRVTGVEPEKVEAEPFQVRSSDGQLVDMRGGYYPIKYETKRSDRSAADEIAEAANLTKLGAYTASTTRRGHTKARVDKVERPVRYDLMVPFQHVTQVIHDLAFHEFLIDANRLVGSGEFEAAVRTHYSPEVLATIKNTLEAVAVGDVVAEHGIDRAVNYVRTGTTIAGLGWNLVTSLLQPLGLTQSVVRVGPKWMLSATARCLTDAATLTNTGEWIASKSPFMQTRTGTFMREVSEVSNQVKDRLTPSAWGPVEQSFFWMIGKLQLVADIPTWVGEYDKHIAGGEDDATAVLLADQAVRDSQGSGYIGDLAQIQRGNVWFKLWTTFYSFFSVAHNQIAESVSDVRRDPKNLPKLAVDVFLISFLPVALGEVIKRAVRGDDWDDFAPSVLKQIGGFFLGMFIGLREFGSVLQSDGKQPASPGGLRVLGSAGHLYADLLKGAHGDLPDRTRRDVVDTFGVLLHLPAAQINRSLDGLEALANGETHNPMALAFGKPHKAH